MSEAEIKGYKARLSQVREEIAGRLSRTAEDGRSTGSGEPDDEAQKAADSYAKEFLFRQNDSVRQRLQEIEDALERIETGEYGFCEATGEPIGKRRLDAVPWARYCVAYQEQHERGVGLEDEGETVTEDES